VEGAVNTSAIPSQSLLEIGDLPLTEIAALAVREGRRPRAIYTAHKWFARRLGTVFRALLVGAVSCPKDDFWSAYYGRASLHGLTVLDPFVGGGTSVVEAGRLGASTIAVDVDPIACSVTNLELTASELPDLEDALEELQNSVGKRLRRYHLFNAPDGGTYEVLHHFWVQLVTCVECGTEFDAHPNFQLAYDSLRQWVICSYCGNIESRHIKHKSFCCGECRQRTIIHAGRVDYGRAMCPECGNCEPLIAVGRRTGAPPRWRRFAVEVLDQSKGRRPVPLQHRLFFMSGSSDNARFDAAVSAYKRRRRARPETFPDLRISNFDRSDTRLIDYGYRRWTELFNPRQLLHLSLLAEAIESFDEPLRTALAMAFSDHLTTNCMLTSYAAGWRRLTPLFSVRAFRHVPRPVELNPWMDGSGRGSFPNTVRKLMRAGAYARSPQEPVLDGGFHSVPVVHAAELPRINCGTARDLSFLADASVDLVLTDPPYFDNIAYSELAEFFLPWLRLLNVVSSDRSLKQVMIESLVGRRTDPDTIARYTAGLSDAFGEMGRVLKPAGIVVFSYRHILPSAWLALANSIATHPLTAVRVLPAPGEGGMGLHAHEGTGLWDAVFVLRRDSRRVALPRVFGTLTIPQVVAAEASASVWARRLADAPLPFTEVDRLTMRRAALVTAALSPQPKCSNDATVSVEQALYEAT